MVSKSKINLDLKIPVGKTYGDEPKKVYLGYGGYAKCFEKNKIFTDTLSYTGFSKGRSSIKFNFKGLEGTEYEMFLKDFSEIAKVQAVDRISGEWAFIKRGSNYGVTLIVE